MIMTHFFCAFMVTMFARFRRAPAPVEVTAQTTTINAESKKLTNALNAIAKLHVNKYAKAIKNAAIANSNAARAAAAAAVNPTPTNVNAAAKANAQAVNAQAAVEKAEENASAAIANVGEPAAEPAPGLPQAEAAAVNAVIKNIQNMNKLVNVNAIRKSNAYTKGSNNNRKRINNALNVRKAAVNPFANKKSNNVNLNASSLYGN